MSHNPPKKPVTLQYFGQAKLLGYADFWIFCLNCGASSRRFVDEAAEHFASTDLSVYEARCQCRECHMKMGYLVFPNGARPGHSYNWWER